MVKYKSKYNTGLEEYQSKFNDIAEHTCKSKAEWKAEEINYTKTDYPVSYKSAGDLQERNQRKLFNYQRTEDNTLQKIKDCDERIKSLSSQIELLETQHFPRKLRKLNNKLVWAKQRRLELEIYLISNIDKQRKYKYLNMKWNGIMQKIISAQITKKIEEEKLGLTNPYYGFGDDRETSPYIHEDNK